MILNVSGRTDIVAFYTKWFMNRYKEGYVMVRNPFNYHLVNEIYFEDVDLIVFCTKNPLPIIDRIKEIDKPILFHITITSYNKDIEPNVIDKSDIIEGVKELSKIIGIDNIYIRYDPIFLSDKYNIEYHIKAFNKLCSMLNGYVKHIIVSFIDDYKNVRKNNNILKIKSFTKEDYKLLGESFSKIAGNNNMTVQTCAEEETLEEYGFIKEECLSHTLAYKLTGKSYKNWTSRKSKYCRCVNMVDIGVYNSCRHFCKYCYANYDENKVIENYHNHDVNSPLLIGNIEENDIGEARSLEQLLQRLRLVRVFYVFLAAALPQPADAAEDIHAVDYRRHLLVEVRAPETQHIVLLVDENIPVQCAEPFRRPDIEDEQPVGADEKMQPMKNFG